MAFSRPLLAIRPSRGRYRQGIRTYGTSLVLNPLSADIWLDLASAYETEGEIDAARKAFLEAKHLYPVSGEVLWAYGNFLLRQNELESAFSEFHRAIEENPQLGGEAIRICRHVEPDFNQILFYTGFYRPNPMHTCMRWEN